jgi:cation:H+ antiporter
MLLLWILILLVSIFVLVKASDFFTDSAEKIGILLGIPQFVVGVTFVAIGTSLPELISSLIAVSKGASEIVVGNVIGSNITNVFLVLGFSAVVSRKIKIEHDILKIDLPLMLGSAFLLVIQLFDGKYTIFEAILSILFVVIYFAYTLNHKHEIIVQTEKPKKPEKKKSAKTKTSLKTKETEKTLSYAKSEKKQKKQIKKPLKTKVNKKTELLIYLLILIVSGLFIYLGAEFTVKAVIIISELIGIGTEIIAVSAVALGTSLPELAVSLVAAKKGNANIAAGNVLGSNIFNSTLVMGIPGLITNIIIPENIFFFALIMIIATTLFFVTTQDREITKWEGFSFLLFYVFFIGSLFTFI